jgi:hypothetical protein
MAADVRPRIAARRFRRRFEAPEALFMRVSKRPNPFLVTRPSVMGMVERTRNFPRTSRLQTACPRLGHEMVTEQTLSSNLTAMWSVGYLGVILFNRRQRNR